MCCLSGLTVTLFLISVVHSVKGKGKPLRTRGEIRHTPTKLSLAHTHFLHQRPVRYSSEKASHTHTSGTSQTPADEHYTETTQLSHWPTVRSYRFIKLMLTNAAETYLPCWL